MNARSHRFPAVRRQPDLRAAGAWPWWLLAAGWMALIFLFSAQPNFTFVPPAWQSDPVSLAAHFLEYAVLAALLWQAARRTPRLAQRAYFVALTLAVVYAASDEWHQTFVPGRVCDGRDWLTDAAGALVGLWLITRLSARRQFLKDRRAAE